MEYSSKLKSANDHSLESFSVEEAGNGVGNNDKRVVNLNGNLDSPAHEKKGIPALEIAGLSVVMVVVGLLLTLPIIFYHIPMDNVEQEVRLNLSYDSIDEWTV